MFNNPFSFQANGGGAYPEGLPSGAVVVYDFTSTDSFTSGDTTVYDLSGNGFNGELKGTVTSGSDSGKTYVQMDANSDYIMFGNDATFRSKFQNQQYMFHAVNYKLDTLPSTFQTATATWGTIGGTFIGYQYFLSIDEYNKTRTGVQMYNSGGTAGATGYYQPANSGISVSTGVRETISLRNTPGSCRSYLDNTLAYTVGTNSSKYFYYGLSGDQGKYMILGNRFDATSDYFRGKIFKFVLYNRDLTAQELIDIDDWMAL